MAYIYIASFGLFLTSVLSSPPSNAPTILKSNVQYKQQPLPNRPYRPTNQSTKPNQTTNKTNDLDINPRTNASNNHNPTQQQPSRATLLSSVIFSVSDSSCQPRSLPAANHLQSSTVDSSSRQSLSSQCLPPASLLALVLLPPGLCLRFPNESFTSTILSTPLGTSILRRTNLTHHRQYLIMALTWFS